MSALKDQVGGSHYKDMRMQPFEFTMANNWDPLAHTMLKYVTRHLAKNGLQDLEKAIHCAALRKELVRGIHVDRGIPAIDMEDFLTANEIVCPSTSRALRALTKWVYSPREAVFGAFGAAYKDNFVEAVQEMIATYYPN